MAEQRLSDTRMIRRLLSDSRAYWPHMAGVLLLSLASAPLALLVPVPLKIAIDQVLGDEPVPAWLTAWLPDAMTQTDAAMLIVAAVMLVVVLLLQKIEGFASWLLQLYSGEKMVLDFRTRLFAHAQRLSLQHHNDHGVTDSLYRIQHDAPGIQYLIIQGVIPAITSVVTIIALVVVTFQIDPLLALTAITIIPVLIILTRQYNRFGRRGWTKVKERESKAMSVVQETLSSIRVVWAFGQEQREKGRFRTNAMHGLRAQMRVVLVESVFGLAVAVTVAGGSAVVLYMGVRHVQAGTLTTGNLLVVYAYIGMLYTPLETLSKRVASLQANIASAERAYHLLDQQPGVPEAKHPTPIGRAQGRITFRQVQFAYSNGAPVLQDVDLDILPGTRVGISGPTGAGKTTLISLMFRFYDPQGGAVLLDGVDLRELALSDLRRQFGVVLQEPVLFAASVAENIAYGRPDATPDQITEAARAANAHDFIQALPQGYDTPVGERGMSLSGGQRQRLSIARAFLADAPILILDEPTSSVDTQSEGLIMQAMQRLIAGRTSITIAHRLSTLEQCDMRLRVEAGRVQLLDANQAATTDRSQA